MKSPYVNRFKVTQKYKGCEHDGFDLVGLNEKTIYSTVSGKVVYAGWENPDNHKQGFGQYVKIQKIGTNEYYYFGHLSEIRTQTNRYVVEGQAIGTEGSTGKSTGSHLHYCVRTDGIKGKHKDISVVSGIPNEIGTYIAKQTNYNGKWFKDCKGWWYQYEIGGYPKSQWLKLDAWYYFDERGYALQDTMLDYKCKKYVFGNDCRCVNP